MAVRIKGNSKGTIGLFRTVIFYDFGNQISFCLIKKTDDSAVKTNRIDPTSSNILLRISSSLG